MGKGKKRGNKNKADEIVEDRFSAAETRPQFRSLKQNKSKVVLDERFSSVLTDPRFQLQGKDKYGRKKKIQGAKEELSAFYTVEDDDRVEKEQKDEKNEETSESSDESASSKDPTKEKDSDSEEEDENENEDPTSRIAYLTAFSRGQLDVSSSSDEDDSSESSEEDDDEDGEDPVYGTAGVLDPSNKEEDYEISYDQSPYLVVTNMDWENVRAVDLFSILSSFTPPGAVKRVQVLQSDFGMERMEKDKLEGPSGIWKQSKVGKASKDADDDKDDAMSDEDSDNSSEGSEELNDEVGLKFENEIVADESDFDPEKLRAYEASKMKYYFAVVEFNKADYADIAYREVDGLEFEHSSAAIDLRTLPAEEVDNVVADRPMRDEATSVPSNYEPPDFIVSALQQTAVKCTWDQGDAERERKLTRYGAGGWQESAEMDDLKAYLASDASSDEDSDDEKADKGSRMRKLLGLDSDAEDQKDDSDQSDSDSEAASSEDEGMSKEVKFVPGQKSLEEKIRSKLDSKEEKQELTPWQKYQEKRKQKRKERRQAARNRRRGDHDQSASDESAQSDNDDFFIDEGKKARTQSSGKKTETNKGVSAEQKQKNELELLLAGEGDEEQARDYDIRGIQRMEKNKGKKLRGSRKRKEDKLAADVSGTDFKVDVNDDRFAAVLDGSDDRFGIDKTDPNFKDTSAMREILSEQTKRRKKKKRRRTENDTVVADVSVDQAEKSVGSSALSSLVQRLKSKVKTSQ